MNYDFRLESTEGDLKTLESYRGKVLVLYFYPKDNTPGCTIESLEFSERAEEFNRLGAVVVGVSKDSLGSHNKFIEKKELKQELLSDPNRDAIRSFGVLKEKKMFGKDTIGTERSTFVFDENSQLIREFRKVKAEGHAQEVLDFLEERAR
ncbi:MAG: peroxiredoxin [Tissierellia bacterium]|nr:peroxiredoxin [Tissierellia bacterium]